MQPQFGGVPIMSTNLGEAPIPAASHAGGRCWVESAVLALAIPGGIWAIDRVMPLAIPAAIHGSMAERFLLWASHVDIVEWLLVAVLWFLLRSRGSSFRDLGLRRAGTWLAWVVALAFAALSILSNLRVLRLMHVPISYAFFPRGFHLATALMIGVTAGFCEELLFRGFLMTEFAAAGYGKFM